MAPPLKVVTTVAMQAVIDKLAPELAQATGFGVAMVFRPPSAAVDLVRGGEGVDVVISTPEGIAELAHEGKVDGGTRQVVAQMIMGLAVGPHEPRPAIGTPDEFRQALLDAKSIIHADPRSGSPSAAHFLKVVESLGIADAIARKTTLRSGVVARAVAGGEGAMAVQQLAELMLVDGVHVLGPFPEALQNVMPLAAAVHTDSRVPQGAKALIGLLAAERTKAIVAAAGLLPAP